MDKVAQFSSFMSLLLLGRSLRWVRPLLRGHWYIQTCFLKYHFCVCNQCTCMYIGRFVFLSYRDPNLLNTLNVYENTANVLSEAEISKEEILQAIIGTRSSIGCRNEWIVDIFIKDYHDTYRHCGRLGQPYDRGSERLRILRAAALWYAQKTFFIH